MVLAAWLQTISLKQKVSSDLELAAGKDELQRRVTYSAWLLDRQGK